MREQGLSASKLQEEAVSCRLQCLFTLLWPAQVDSGAVGTGCVALWDPLVGQWSMFGSVLEGVIMAVVTNSTTVYIGGRFSSVASSSAPSFQGLAVYDGVDWAPLSGGGISGGDVHSMAIGSDNLYVGGSFVRAGGLEVNR